jgi:hypothetical protein
MTFLNWLESTGYSQWILVSSTGWPLMLTLHALGLAIIVGVIFSLDLRLLGFYKAIPYSSLHKLFSIAWIGIVMNVITGLSIFMTQASTYVTSPPFLIKISFIVIGCVNLYYTQKVLDREAESWEAAGVATRQGHGLAASSLFFWIVAVVTGRLIAYI